MADRMQSARPRVALVYGDDEAAEHVRTALAEHVDIVYAAGAGAFDVARLAEARPSAALVNLDGEAWLDDVEAALKKAGIPAIFNDPETSRSLEGWDRARWLRHLVAKLGGRADYDPPRPAVEAASESFATFDARELAASESDAPTAAPALQPHPAIASASNASVASDPVDATAAVIDAGAGAHLEAAAAEPEADFDGGPEVSESSRAQSAPAEPQVEVAAGSEALEETMTVPATTAESLQASVGAAPAATVESGLALEPLDAGASEGDAVAPADPEALPSASGEDAALDVDTEELSAMIDARLAEATGHDSAASQSVWRVAEEESASPPTVAPAADDPMTPVAEPATDSSTAAATPAPAPAPAGDEPDILKGMPELGDWSLVDRDAPVEPVKRRPAGEPATVLGELAGLELVPMDSVAPVVDAHREPIENWLRVEIRKQGTRDPGRPAAADDDGDAP